MIPKHIFTIWLQEEGPLPELVRRCLCSQDEMAIHFGYTFRLITLNNCFKDHPYVQQCLSSPHLKKRWCKLSDFLRMHYLLVDGGIYLDADVEMLPNKNFDELLDAKMFVGQEQYATPGSGLEPFYGTAVVGAEQGYPFVQRWMDEVVEKFRGDDDKNFESSMLLMTNRYVKESVGISGMLALPADYFYPYCHEAGTVRITDRTICYHHFMKSWI